MKKEFLVIEYQSLDGLYVSLLFGFSESLTASTFC